MIKYIVVLLASLLFSPAQAAILEGRVVGVADGDTITVLDASNTQYKVRLSGIDAPEKKQPFGQVSKKSLSDLVYNKTVQVDWSKVDRYSRIVGKVWVNDLDANLEQVKRGLAWHYTKYSNEQPLEDRHSYLDAQEDARASQAGLWVEPNPIPPWDWRKATR
ncbi:thermonuclease family protein [Methylotenera sp. L2L1]|uniref:thermonuclease family protein n=1 Tax=Methylotenera sp. L2L1 TaxID=1502770 RepID=UPI00055E4A3D|nr:thermonuclease family protein [Methylotenera sp. L2L1]